MARQVTASPVFQHFVGLPPCRRLYYFRRAASNDAPAHRQRPCPARHERSHYRTEPRRFANVGSSFPACGSKVESPRGEKTNKKKAAVSGLQRIPNSFFAKFVMSSWLSFQASQTDAHQRWISASLDGPAAAAKTCRTVIAPRSFGRRGLTRCLRIFRQLHMQPLHLSAGTQKV
jgi:hypothetical protein